MEWMRKFRMPKNKMKTHKKFLQAGARNVWEERGSLSYWASGAPREIFAPFVN